jgi:hypothetical protein
VIDIDEFLLPIEGHSVPSILRDRECFPALALNWVVYGSNGHLSKQDGLVIERFKNHTSWNHSQNWHTKVIVNPRMVRRYMVHDHIYQGKCHARNVIGQRIRGEFFTHPPVWDILRINHYFSKSREEFQAKRARGRASIANRKVAWNLMQAVDEQLAERPDVVTGDAAIDWAIPFVRENLGNRTLPVEKQSFHVHRWPAVIMRQYCGAG